MDQTRTPDTESSTQLLTLTEASFRLGRRVVYRREDIDRWITTQHDSQAVRPR